MADFPMFDFVAISKRVLFVVLFAYFVSKVIAAVQKLDAEELKSHSLHSNIN